MNNFFIWSTIMKNSKLIAAAAAIGVMLGIGVASAADLPMKAMPYVAPPPPFSWSGFYIGGNAGAGILLDQGFLSQTGLLADRHGFGGLAGGQVGYNWQMGMLVLGIEGEGFWSGMKVTQDGFFGNPGTLGSIATIKNRWDFDIAGRFGIAIDHALIYGKAGWVAGNFAWNLSEPLAPGFNTNGSATLNGLLIGLGLEYAFTNNWTVKFEYDYLGFPAKDVLFTTCLTATCTPSFTATQSVSADKHIFKVGFNYLFNYAPVVAKY
jgi:outer membrane immunogenic protein